VEVYLLSFFKSALVASVWSTSRPNLLPEGKDPLLIQIINVKVILIIVKLQ